SLRHKAAALRHFNPAYVADGVIRARSTRRSRSRHVASPPEATKLLQLLMSALYDRKAPITRNTTASPTIRPVLGLKSATIPASQIGNSIRTRPPISRSQPKIVTRTAQSAAQ